MNIKEAMEKIKTGDDMMIDLSYLATMVLEKEHSALRHGYMKPFAFSPSSFEAEAYKAGVIDMADRIILGLAELAPAGEDKP